MKQQHLHLGVGALGLIAFAVQGQFMEALQVSNLPDGQRMMYRTAHLYLMMASVINIVMGLVTASITGKLSQWLFRIVSLVFLASPLLFVLSFVLESTNAELMRPIAVFTQYGVFGGGALTAVLVFLGRFEKQAPE